MCTHDDLLTLRLDGRMTEAGHRLHHPHYDWLRLGSGKWPYAGVSLVAQDAILE